MRLWHWKLLPYLPEAQFKGQLRELMLIQKDWKEKGATNHLLINKVMNYPKNDLCRYFLAYEIAYHKRYGKWLIKQWPIMREFDDHKYSYTLLYEDWHNEEYLRVCMANLYEKYKFGQGKSKITDEEWYKLLEGYKDITGKCYTI